MHAVRISAAYTGYTLLAITAGEKVFSNFLDPAEGAYLIRKVELGIIVTLYNGKAFLPGFEVLADVQPRDQPS